MNVPTYKYVWLVFVSDVAVYGDEESRLQTPSLLFFLKGRYCLKEK